LSCAEARVSNDRFRFSFPAAIPNGQDFLERTSAISINLHGCGILRGTICMLEAGLRCSLARTRSSRLNDNRAGQVKSVHMPQSPRELHHVGVELETPGNIWSVPTRRRIG